MPYINVHELYELDSIRERAISGPLNDEESKKFNHIVATLFERREKVNGYYRTYMRLKYEKRKSEK